MAIDEDPYRAQMAEDGFVVVQGLVSGDELAALQAAAERTAAKARAGDWPYVRTVGKQFPPWEAWNRAAAEKARASGGADQAGIWGVQHLMRPGLGAAEEAALFTRSYFAQGGVLDVAKRLLACGDDALVMELCNMLVRPDYRDFALRWHRDDIPAEAAADEERAALAAAGAWHAQWNLALFEDASLVVVPGSHRRARTAAERAADPFAATLPVAPGNRPQVTVHLAPGDAVFYNNNILHRGVYRTAVPRATLHGSVGHAGGSRVRARNVLQHGVGSWVERCDFSALAPAERARAEAMRARLLEMGRDAAGPVTYSLEG